MHESGPEKNIDLQATADSSQSNLPLSVLAAHAHPRRSGVGKLRRLASALCTAGLAVALVCVLAWFYRGHQPRQASGAYGYRIDINTASAHELAQLPGWGLTLASAVVRSRRELGRFDAPDRLLRVPGMSVRLVNRAKPYICVDGQVGSEQQSEIQKSHRGF